MKKDIPTLKVKDIAVAVIPREGVEADFWEVYLINLKEEPIHSVLVNSTGYGEVNGEKVKTTTLRYFYDDIKAATFEKIEILQQQLTELANEYWISFSLNGHLYDKRYIFVRGSLDAANYTRIPIIDKEGVMIR